MSPQNKKKVVIIGAGIVGVSAAVWLQRDGHEVLLVDRKGPAGGASHGNGGVLASCAVVPVTVPGLLYKAPRMLLDPDQPLYLKWPYLPKLAPWLVKYLKHANAQDTRRIASALAPIIGDSLEDHLALAKGTIAAKYIRPCEYAYIYKNREAFEQDAFAWGIRRENGFEWREIEGDEVTRWQAGLAADQRFAAVLGNHGRISDPGVYVGELANHVVQNGGKLIRGEFDDFLFENGKLNSVLIGGEPISCDAALVATGAWSRPLMRKLGLKVPLESERGYHLELLEPSIMPDNPLMVASGKFVATPMERRLRLAGILEFGGLKAEPSRAPFRMLENNVKKVFPGIVWKDQKEWMGHRPAPADSIPVIGEISGKKGVFAGFGHHHVGLTGGPKTGRILAQLISEKNPNIDLAQYSPMRFS